MEKKGNRLLQVSPKGLSTDSKKNQDVVSGKAWPRGSRRREPSGSSLSSKHEPVRGKPNPQRNKVTVDKRPRTRGAYQPPAALASRNETTGLEEYQDAELGSVFLPGSKKQSLNHLLNFHYAPREGHHVQNHHHHNSGRNNKQHGRFYGTQKHKYNKEHFLQANCQFIVNASGDYKQFMNNPDALVDWDLIEQVNLQVSEFPSCPICLYPPAAAKITRCGHIYCWACMLHYLTLSENSWRKCPICYEAVHKKDLKSVVAVPHATFNVDETITFKLMKRAKGSLTAYPVDFTAREDDVIFSLSDREYGSVYSKLVLADCSHILSIIEREGKELEHQLNDEDNNPVKCFIDQAIALLKEREDSVCASMNVTRAPDQHQRSSKFERLDSIAENFENAAAAAAPLKVHQDSSGIDDITSMIDDIGNVSFNDECGNVIDTVINEESDECPDTSAELLDVSNDNLKDMRKFYYFYQASDGQHIYLHPVNAKMLEHTYGSLENAPKTITGKILEKEGGSMTEDIRRRLCYLRHLPVTCQFEFAEIQLKYPVVNRETLDDFRQQLQARQKTRSNRLKDERRREKRIVEEENRKMGKFPRPNLQLESHLQFPEFGVEPPRERTVSEDNVLTESSTSSVSETPLSSSWGSQPDPAAPSFAKMLSRAKARPPTWPTLKPSTSATSTPTKYINATGSNMKVTVKQIPKGSDSENENDDYQLVPPSERSFGDVIAQALERAAHNTSESGDSVAVGKKKKKNKQKVLFATNMAYSGN